jgi:hypothetical protein
MTDLSFSRRDSRSADLFLEIWFRAVKRRSVVTDVGQVVVEKRTRHTSLDCCGKIKHVNGTEVVKSKKNEKAP